MVIPSYENQRTELVERAERYKKALEEIANECEGMCSFCSNTQNCSARLAREALKEGK